MKPTNFESGASPAARKPLQILAAGSWAIFLASSWTWCIGMFFPALLLRDYGSVSWWIFTIPNVIGAASMPWILKNKNASQEFLVTHGTATTVFSLVTIIFQMFFMGWLLSALPLPVVLLVGIVVLLMSISMSLGSDLPMRVWGVLVWCISTALFVYYLNAGSFTEFAFMERGNFSSKGPWHLAGLIAVFLMGFTFCPYLDVTFHKARQQLDGPAAKPAFFAGFFLFFLLMLAFTAAYARDALQLMFGDHAKVLSAGALAIAVHISLQACYTALAHHKCAKEMLPTYRVKPLLIAALVAGVCGYLLSQPVRLFGLDAREIIYLGFIAFYGFMAPAYLWLNYDKPRHQQVIKPVLAAILLSFPFFGMAFYTANAALAYLSIFGTIVIAGFRYATRKHIVPVEKSLA